MSEEPAITSPKTNIAAFIAAFAIGLSLVSGGVLLRRQQDQTRLAAIAATDNAPPTATILVEVEVTALERETDGQPDAPEQPDATELAPTAAPLSEGSTAPQVEATVAPPTATAIPASVLSIADSYPPPSEPPVTEIPPPAEPIPVPKGTTNILLLGSDIRPDDPGYRTDTIIVLSINRDNDTVSMLSLPRDLFVYIPGWTMARINTADSRGASVGWDGGGPGLVRETLLYNFGIQTDHYARVDFDGFINIVDALGGIDVPVDCAFQDYIPLSFDLSQEELEDEENWKLHTLPVGVHHLDGNMALWYARARIRTSDYDRARRQQQVLRSIWNEALGLGWLEPGPQSVTRLTSLWVTSNELVETSMGVGNALQFAPIAANLDTSRIRSYFVGPDYLIGWQTPDGSSVSLPIPGAIEELAQLALQAPAANVAAANTATIEIRNGSSIDRLDEVASDRLGWAGMAAVPTGQSEDSLSQTMIYDFKASLRGGQLFELQQSLRVPLSNVITQPDPDRTVDYLVIVGEDFSVRSCSPQRFVPTPVPVSPAS